MREGARAAGISARATELKGTFSFALLLGGEVSRDWHMGPSGLQCFEEVRSAGIGKWALQVRNALRG